VQVDPKQETGDELVLVGVGSMSSLAHRACSANAMSARRLLRRLPNTSVASRAALTPWPMASVTDMCSTSRSTL